MLTELAIMCYSGAERPNTPATAAERVGRLLDSIFSDPISPRRVVVCDDGPHHENPDGVAELARLQTLWG